MAGKRMTSALSEEAERDAEVLDVRADDDGTVWRLTPLTAAAKAWFAENVHAEPWQWFGQALVVDHRFARPILAGIVEAGLTV